jgi:hypothetical protein
MLFQGKRDEFNYFKRVNMIKNANRRKSLQYSRHNLKDTCAGSVQRVRGKGIVEGDKW